MNAVRTYLHSDRSHAFWWMACMLFYLTGAAGLHSPYRSWFVELTPPIMIASVAALWASRQHPQESSVTYLIWIYVAGVLAEWLGVNTGFPFGTYRYGSALGIQSFGTPWVIGCNWILVTLISGELAEKMFRLPFTRIVAGAAFCTLLDILIEPSAIALGFWAWEGGSPPLSNYIGWFCVSLLLQASGLLFRYRFASRASMPLLAGNLVFLFSAGGAV